MSTESLMPTFGDDSPDADALKSAVEAAFGPGAFALISEPEGGTIGDDAILPDFDTAAEDPDRQRGETVAPSEQPGPRQYVLFELADVPFAVRIENVLEIQPVSSIARLLGVPDWVCGITSLRGAILSVVDVGHFLGLPVTEGARKMVVVRSRADDLTTGLIVERIVGIGAVHGTPATGPDFSEESDLRFVDGSILDHGQSYLLLNLEELLLSREFRQLHAV